MSDIKQELARLREKCASLEEKLDQQLYITNSMYQRFEDVSSKLDMLFNAGTQKPVTKAKTTTVAAVPKNKNIMTYFKSKFSDDPNFFNDILEEKQVESIEAANKDALDAKKGAQKKKTKITLIYKSLTAKQKKMLREKMLNENEIASQNNSPELKPEAKSDD